MSMPITTSAGLRSSLAKTLASLFPKGSAVRSSLIVIETVLIATPILVIVWTVAFHPTKGKTFFDTVTSKPEWYFITLVFCIEAFRDWIRIRDKTHSGGSETGLLWAFAIILPAVVLAVLATLAALGQVSSASQIVVTDSGQPLGTPSRSAPQAHELSILEYFAIPFFLISAMWSVASKYKWKAVEREVSANEELIAEVTLPRVYNAEKAGRSRAFYARVADVYHKRNDKTRGIRTAHNFIVSAISDLATNGPISVLDLGAGTGYNVFNSVRYNSKISWTAVDESPRMLGKFKEDFSQVETVEGDCVELLRGGRFNGRAFDVVVLSFVLSSMPRSLDFSALARSMRAGGLLLIADIHPGYVTKSRCFDIEVDRKYHALRLRKVDPLVLEEESKQSFRRVRWELFPNERDEVYSFVLAFEHIAP